MSIAGPVGDSWVDPAAHDASWHNTNTGGVSLGSRTTQPYKWTGMESYNKDDFVPWDAT